MEKIRTKNKIQHLRKVKATRAKAPSGRSKSRSSKRSKISKSMKSKSSERLGSKGTHRGILKNNEEKRQSDE